MGPSLDIEGVYEKSVLEDALREYRKVFVTGCQQAEAGKRPNWSIDGAKLIIADIDKLQKKVEEL